MKRLILLLLLCSQVQAADEIRAFVAGATTCYYVVREADGDIWDPSANVFEDFGAGAHTMADYDIALVDESGDMFAGDMDTDLTAGQFYVITYQQAGGAPADTDPAVWVEYGYWTGSVWTSGPDASDIDSIIAKLPTNYIMGSDDQDDHNAELEDWVDGARLDLIIDAILADTSDYDTDAEYAAAIWSALIASYSGEATFGGELQSLDPNITLILADTGELQTDWADGGRLDLILDDILTDTGAYDTDAEYAAAIWNALIASYGTAGTYGEELEELDPNITLIKAITDYLMVLVSDVNDANDANNFTLTDGKAANDAYLGHIIMIEDADDSNLELRLILDWGSNLEVDVDYPFSFTPAGGDKAWIIATAYLGEIYQMIQYGDDGIYVFDRSGGTGAGQGMTVYNAAGDDP